MCINDDYLKYGFYVRGIVPVLTDMEIKNPDIVREIRNKAASLQIPHWQWLDYIDAFYRDLPRIFVNERGYEVFLDMDVFDTLSIKYWFRDFCTFVPSHMKPRVRVEAWERVRMFGTLMRAHPAPR